MDMKKRKYNIFDKFKKSPEANLREAARSYLYTVIKLYIKVEGKVSIWDPDRFGDSANIVCSLNRAIEHLLKLRLLKIDPLLLYPFPKSIEYYCIIKNILSKKQKNTERKIKESVLQSRTISFKEALCRVDLTQADTDFDFKCFNKINFLRNSLEHHWDRNEEFLQEVVGMMSKKVIPCLKNYIESILKEDFYVFIDDSMTMEVERLDRALEAGHTLKLQNRLENHKKLYDKDPANCKKTFILPKKYKGLSEEKIEAKCPVCKEQLVALWDMEADYDVEGGYTYIVDAYPDAKCLFCYNCHFFIDGPNISTYLPNGLKIEFDIDYDWF
jgi:hypothetical protein